MNYTIEDYKKGQLPNIKDIVKIGEFTFDISHSTKGFWLSGIGCDNDAFVKYLKGEDKYHFAKRVTAEYGGADEEDTGTCPYINTINGLTELIKALWDMANSKESESSLLKENDVVNIGPFQYQIQKGYSGFFLNLNNRIEVKDEFGDISGGNDAIFRLLQINKNTFFCSILKDECKTISDESTACPYAKTIEGINEVIRCLQAEYSIFVNHQKKETKSEKRHAVSCDEILGDYTESSPKNISITIPKKSSPVKLKIIL